MKYKFVLFLIATTLLACKSQGTASWTDHSIVSMCPEKTECKLEILENKSLLVKSDDTGHLYYQIQDEPGKKVLLYTSRKITDPQLMDAGYSETLIFETDKKLSNLNNTGINMQNTKMLLGIQCFCRGKAGFYKVESGTIKYAKNKLHIEIPGIVEDQKTREVTVTFN